MIHLRKYNENLNIHKLLIKCEDLVNKYGKPPLGIGGDEWFSVLLPVYDNEIIDFSKNYRLEIMSAPEDAEFLFTPLI